MVVTIYECYDKHHVILKSNNKEFKEKYGSHIYLPTDTIYKKFSEIATWANNDLKEECLFEVD